MKSVRIAIMGTPISSRNQGVLALASSLVNLCASLGHGETILMLSHDNNHPVKLRVKGQLELIRVVNCRLSPRSRLCDHLFWINFAALLYRSIPLKVFRKIISRATPWISALEKADIVGDVRGGDSFSDIYGMQRFLFGFVTAWTVLLVKGSLVQFPQTFGPYKNPLTIWLARYLLKRSSVVIARDKTSRKIAQGLLGPSREVWLSPDVAFLLEPIRPEVIELDPPLESRLLSKVIGLNINGLMYNGGYTRNNMFGLHLDYRNLLPLLVKALLNEYTGELWLIPHTYGPPGSVESDPEACRQVWQVLPEELKGRVRIVNHEYDQHEIKGVIGKCDFFIGSRMHACIAALSQGIPCVGVAYSMKFEGVFDSVGMHGWVVDGRRTTTDAALSQILELYRQRDLVRSILEVNADKARDQLMDVFNRLILKHINPD